MRKMLIFIIVMEALVACNPQDEEASLVTSNQEVASSVTEEVNMLTEENEILKKEHSQFRKGLYAFVANTASFAAGIYLLML